MQRVIVVVTALMVLMGGGLIAGYKFVYKPNRPNPIWVPLAVRGDLEIAKRNEFIKGLKEKLSEPGLLAAASKDLGLAAKWGKASDEEAGRDIGKRVFVRFGEMDTPKGKVPAILVGVNGKFKEAAESERIAKRLMKDVFEFLGISPPPDAGK